jgi:hypothetical protein
VIGVRSSWDASRDEVALTLEQPALALGQPANLVEGGLAPVDVPHDRDEHGSHQRHLEQLVEACARVDECPGERDPGRQHHGEQDE